MLELIMGAAAALAYYILFTTTLWTPIHEYSHLIAVKLTVGTNDYLIRLYPHILSHENGEQEVGGSLRYIPNREPKPMERFFISMAPRVMEFLVMAMYPVAIWFMKDLGFIPAMTLLGISFSGYRATINALGEDPNKFTDLGRPHTQVAT